MDGYIAQVKLFAATFAPRNWSLCQGQIMSISQNTALFSLLGTTYGGNGQTNFALPNFAGRVAMGAGQGQGLPYVSLGEMAGTTTTTLTVANLPAHTHAVTTSVITSASSTNDGGDIPVGMTWAHGVSGFSNAKGLNMNPGAVTANVNVTAAGGGQAFTNMQPYLGMNFIICLYGIFPSRN